MSMRSTKLPKKYHDAVELWRGGVLVDRLTEVLIETGAETTILF